MSRCVGIDPGKKTGIAVYDKTLGRLIDVWTTDFWGAYDFVKREDLPIDKVIIEVPRTKANWHRKGCDITSANVGGIYREAHLLADGIEKLGLTVIRQHPPGKVDAEYIKRLTGWDQRTCEHKRDAIMLCWGY